MASLESLATSRGKIYNFDPRALKTKPELNARNKAEPGYQEHIRWLADSIKLEGVREPLTIFLEGDETFVEHGHCRLEATLLAISEGAPVATVPCVGSRKGTNNVDRILTQVIANGGRGLAPIEKAVAFKHALGMGASVSDIVAKTAHSETYVHKMLELLGAPQDVLNLVSAGQVSAATAARAVRKGPSSVAALRVAATTKKRVTQADIEADDPLWALFRRLVSKRRERPVGLDDAFVEHTLTRMRLR